MVLLKESKLWTDRDRLSIRVLPQQVLTGLYRSSSLLSNRRLIHLHKRSNKAGRGREGGANWLSS